MEGPTTAVHDERAVRALDILLIAALIAIGWAGMIAARTRPDLESAPFTAPMAAVAVAAAIPLWWRRERPLGMLAAVLACLVVAGAIDDRGLFSIQIVVESLVLCFAVGAWTSRPRLAVGTLVVLMALIVLGAASDGANVVAAAAYSVALIALPAVAGYATRTRRQYLAEVEQRLAEAERDRDERARRAVQEERNRIARELHDVVAHHVSLIGVQAGAARTALDGSPEQTRAALEAIESSSRAAVGEMRQLLDALAPLPGNDGAADVLAPQPALTQLQPLAQRWRAAGVAVELVVVGDVAAVPPSVSLCCYRIVEEALTNVARHSPARRATVRVEVAPMAVRIEVTDPGDSVAPAPGVAASGEAVPGSGRGLVGMRERVGLFGGELTVGPVPGGGFRVTATIPWSAG